jgi:outer membrane protein W
MKLLGLSIATMGISLFAGAARAQTPGEAADRGAIELGFRVGYGIPAGKEGATAAGTSANLSDDLSGIIPFIVEGGYRFNSNVYLGLAFQYAPGLVNTDSNATCNQSGVDCSGTDLQLSINFHYHLAPEQSFDPWLGIGAGYEWMTLSVSANGASGSATASGFQLANLQAGGDFRVAPNFVLGPFLSVSFGQFRGLSLSGPGYSMDMDITNTAIHEWILFGVRGAYDAHL